MTQHTLTTAWDGHWMLPDFLSCVVWASREKSLRERYLTETGNQIGTDIPSIQLFCQWVALEIFGTPEDVFGPDPDDPAGQDAERRLTEIVAQSNEQRRRA